MSEENPPRPARQRRDEREGSSCAVYDDTAFRRYRFPTIAREREKARGDNSRKTPCTEETRGRHCDNLVATPECVCVYIVSIWLVHPPDNSLAYVYLAVRASGDSEKTVKWYSSTPAESLYSTSWFCRDTMAGERTRDSKPRLAHSFPRYPRRRRHHVCVSLRLYFKCATHTRAFARERRRITETVGCDRVTSTSQFRQVATITRASYNGNSCPSSFIRSRV